MTTLRLLLGISYRTASAARINNRPLRASRTPRFRSSSVRCRRGSSPFPTIDRAACREQRAAVAAESGRQAVAFVRDLDRRRVACGCTAGMTLHVRQALLHDAEDGRREMAPPCRNSHLRPKWWRRLCQPTQPRLAAGCGGRTRTSDHRINNSAFVSGHTRISPFLSSLPRTRLVCTCPKECEIDTR